MRKESIRHLQLALQKIKNKGAKAFVAINPATPICALEEILNDIDGILVMTVNPGFAGQKLVFLLYIKSQRCENFLTKTKN